MKTTDSECHVFVCDVHSLFPNENAQAGVADENVASFSTSVA
jgi:hypothetical protein